MTNQVERTFDLDDLHALAHELLEQFNGIRIWLFQGEVGAGKTTLIKALCMRLGSKEGLSSPTFSIVNEYENKLRLVHMDLYRIKQYAELMEIGIEEYLSECDYCFIEWPELIRGHIHQEFVEISLTSEAETGRKIRAVLGANKQV